MDIEKEITHKPNGWALLPLCVFFLLYLFTWIFTRDISKMPISVAFLTTSIVAILFSRGKNFNYKVDVFCRGAASNTVMMMILIFILAGAFAGTAQAMGAVDATVQAVLSILPQNMIMASIFLAACFISMAMGTSCGTIAALTPIAVGLSSQLDLSLPEVTGIIVGGSMFGDNLSFISDTTIVATRTQECRMQDKFKVNIRIVLPAAIIIFLYYLYKGYTMETSVATIQGPVEWVKIIPYLAVLVTALAGVNVIVVLVIGFLLSGIIGLADNSFTIWNWTEATSNGIIGGMGELIIVTLMAGGMFEIIRYNGGIDWLILKMTRNIKSKRSAEFSIAGLTSFTDLCTANNTIALIISGPIAKKIGDEFNIDNRRIASLIDTFSCFVQGIIPYGAQLLIASGLAKISTMEIIPYLYYPMLMGIFAILAIVFQYPGKYTKRIDN